MCQHTEINKLIGACLFSFLKYEIIKCKQSSTEQINQIQKSKSKYENTKLSNVWSFE